MAGWKDPAHRLDVERLHELWRQIDWQIGLNSPPGSGRIDLVICGGAAMCYANPERGTGDVDSMHRLPAVVREAANTVGKRRGLESGWLNDAPSRFTDYSNVIAPNVIFEGQFLRVSAPHWDYLLGMKVIAGRADDQQDIYELMEKLNIYRIEGLYRAAQRVALSVGSEWSPTREEKRALRGTVRAGRRQLRQARRQVRRQAREMKKQKRAEAQRGAEQE